MKAASPRPWAWCWPSCGSCWGCCWESSCIWRRSLPPPLLLFPSEPPAGLYGHLLLFLTLIGGIFNSKLLDAEQDAERLASMVDFCFCAVDMPKDAIRALEETYAKLECPIVSNNSAHRWTEDVPMVVPEINAEHLAIIEAQRKRLGTKRGFIAVKSNCSLQSYVPALHPLMKYGLERALVCTYQAISGAGKTFQRWPEMVDNCIPYIGGEEEKSEQEPLKLWGRVENGRIVKAEGPASHRPVLPGSLSGRPHGRSVHEIQGRLQALHGADQSGLGRIPGPSAGIAVTLRPQAISPLF